MLKLELDWAGDEAPETSVEDEAMRIEYDKLPGPAGWPTVTLYAWTLEGEPAYMAAMRLQGWLKDEYLRGLDEDEMVEQAEELAGLADEV